METTEQKEKRLTKTLKALKACAVDNVQTILREQSYSALKEMEKVYFDAYLSQEEDGEHLSAMVINEKYRQVNEARTIMEGNEEEIWDCLT